jgi:transcription initiation factor TFIIB|uniref:Transcription initiation factor IIB family protein n=2 Tax=Candidatus Aramenus sulfurataquae TaxID=1326980 RepID=A0AAE3K2A8_9CREN|nr:transcription initiation factor IIB family protein [Candidatus Aramenus sulfurataquae]
MRYSQYIRNVCFNLGMPYSEEVVELFYNMKEKKKLRGRPLKAVVGALIYITARKHGVPLSFDDIAKVLNVDKRQLIARAKSIIKENNFTIAPPPVDAYLKMVAQKLSLPELVVNDALKIAKALERDVMTKKETIVAGAIYASASMHGLKLTQRDVALASGTSEVSLRKVLKKIRGSELQLVLSGN